MKRLAVLIAAMVALAGCGTIAGTPTWPGAKLEAVVLTEADFPAGVRYTRIIENPGVPDGAEAPPPMLSEPVGCTDGLTKVIAAKAERGPGSAVKYDLGYDGARISVTVLSWNLDLDALAAEAERCAHFETFFDRQSPGIPMTTVSVPAEEGLLFEQTMTLGATEKTVDIAFRNVGAMAVFGMASVQPNPDISAKAELPQTFLDVMDRQSERMRAFA